MELPCVGGPRDRQRITVSDHMAYVDVAHYKSLDRDPILGMYRYVVVEIRMTDPPPFRFLIPADGSISVSDAYERVFGAYANLK